jgi:D-amino-acid dehydrogenase
MRGTGAEKHLLATGRLSIYRREAGFLSSEDERVAARELGIPFEILSAQDMATLEPHLKPVYAKGVRWPESRRLSNPGAVVAAYEEKFVRDGGVFTQAEVWRLKPQSDSWRIETLGDPIEATEIVIAAGPWSAEVLKPLGYRFPLGFKRGYHQHFAARGDASLAHAIVDVDIGYVLTGMEQGYRLVTGTEIAALRAPPNPVQIERALPYARELFPLGEPLDHNPWCGARPCFADSLPVIGPAPRHRGLWLNFGHGPPGMTIGPPAGRLLAEMMTGEKPFCDPEPYRATRFSC